MFVLFFQNTIYLFVKQMLPRGSINFCPTQLFVERIQILQVPLFSYGTHNPTTCFRIQTFEETFALCHQTVRYFQGRYPPRLYRRPLESWKDHLKATEYKMSPNDIESVWLSVNFKGQTLLFGSVYRPPSQKNFLKNFKLSLDRIGHRSNIIIMGDINIDLSACNKSDTNKKLMHDYNLLLMSNNLTNIIKDFTRVTSESLTLIDHALMSDTSKLIHSNVYDPSISDHNLIYLVLSLKRMRQPPIYKMIKNYKDVDVEQLRRDMSSVPWSILSSFEDIDDTNWGWSVLYNDVLKLHVKERKVKIRSQSQPWMDGGLRKKLNHRYKLLLLAQKTVKGSNAWTEYKKKRNQCTKLIRETKNCYWKNKFTNSKSSKEFWALIKTFQGRNHKSKMVPIKDIDGSLVTEDQGKANTLNKYFATIGQNMAVAHHSQPSTTHWSIGSHQHVRRYASIPNTLINSFQNYQNLGNHSGLDGVSAKDLHVIGEPALDGLRHLFQRSIDTLQLPTAWKKARVSCIYKNKGAKSDCENYRPVSILSIPSKIMESIVCKNIDNHLEQHALIYNRQWGFRKNHSTITALLHMTETWKKLVDNKMYVGVLFLDFRKAFDSLDHGVIVKKLSACGISGNLYEWIANYLSHRQQVTLVNGKISTDTDVKCGAPQGSLLGPRLFSITANDLDPKSRANELDQISCETDLFADDTTSTTHDQSIDGLFVKAQMVNGISHWSHRNCLTIHPKKSVFMIISPKAFIGPLPQKCLDDHPIAVVSETKCLGLTIDNKLNWSTHISQQVKKLSTKLKKLYQMRSLPSLLNTVYLQGILPSATYGLSIWGNGSKMQTSKNLKIYIGRLPDSSIVSRRTCQTIKCCKLRGGIRLTRCTNTALVVWHIKS